MKRLTHACVFPSILDFNRLYVCASSMSCVCVCIKGRPCWCKRRTRGENSAGLCAHGTDPLPRTQYIHPLYPIFLPHLYCVTHEHAGTDCLLQPKAYRNSDQRTKVVGRKENIATINILDGEGKHRDINIISPLHISLPLPTFIFVD